MNREATLQETLDHILKTIIASRNPFIVEEVLQKGKVLYEREPVAALAC